MLMPKKVKYRKVQRGRMKGMAQRGSSLSFGDYGRPQLGRRAIHGVIEGKINLPIYADHGPPPSRQSRRCQPPSALLCPPPARLPDCRTA